MCEFKIIVKELGKESYLATEDISYLKVQDIDGAILLKGLGIHKKVDTAIIKEVNVYADEGATAKLFKAPIIGDFMNFLRNLEAGAYSPELEETWEKLKAKGKELIDQLKKE